MARRLKFRGRSTARRTTVSPLHARGAPTKVEYARSCQPLRARPLDRQQQPEQHGRALYPGPRHFPTLARTANPTAFKLSEIQPDSIFQQIGLRDGDVLTGVGGQSVGDPAKAMQLLATLRNQNSISLTVMRDGQPVQLQYNTADHGTAPGARGERDEVLDLLALWYGDRDFFARYNHHDQRLPRRPMPGRMRGRPYSSRPRKCSSAFVNLRGARVPLGGVGSVYTMGEPSQPRPRLGAMRLAVTTMERESFEVSLLFAERLDFYARFGWRPVTRQFSALADTRTMSAAAGFRLAPLRGGT